MKICIYNYQNVINHFFKLLAQFAYIFLCSNINTSNFQDTFRWYTNFFMQKKLLEVIFLIKL